MVTEVNISYSSSLFDVLVWHPKYLGPVFTMIHVAISAINGRHPPASRHPEVLDRAESAARGSILYKPWFSGLVRVQVGFPGLGSHRRCWFWVWPWVRPTWWIYHLSMAFFSGNCDGKPYTCSDFDPCSSTIFLSVWWILPGQVWRLRDFRIFAVPTPVAPQKTSQSRII